MSNLNSFDRIFPSHENQRLVPFDVVWMQFSMCSKKDVDGDDCRMNTVNKKVIGTQFTLDTNDGVKVDYLEKFFVPWKSKNKYRFES